MPIARVNDAVVRSKVREILTSVRRHVDAAEVEFRQQHLPPPTRDRPRHDPEAIRQAQLIEAIGREIGALEGQIRALPAFLDDHMSEIVRQDRVTGTDQALIAHAEFLGALLAPESGQWMARNAAEIQACIQAVRVLVQERSGLS
ncbi:MAG: hypothetical protein ACRYGI_13890 [Janthinobacterium lividum]